MRHRASPLDDSPAGTGDTACHLHVWAGEDQRSTEKKFGTESSLLRRGGLAPRDPEHRFRHRRATNGSRVRIQRLCEAKPVYAGKSDEISLGIFRPHPPLRQHSERSVASAMRWLPAAHPHPFILHGRIQLAAALVLQVEGVQSADEGVRVEVGNARHPRIRTRGSQCPVQRSLCAAD